MHAQKEAVYVFDKDGVLVESEPIKLALFEELLGQDYPQHVDAIRKFNREQMGLARKDKLRHVLGEIIGITERLDDKIEEYLDRSYHFVKKELIKAPPVTGVLEFIASSPNPKYVCSAALHPEVMDQLDALDIRDAFDEVYGFPDKKADVLRRLKDRHSGQPIVFWGDTLFDYEASVAARVNFIGLRKVGHSTFDTLDVHTIDDFTDADALRHWIASNAQV